MINKISLFSGGGGLDLGFAAAGYRSRLCTDIDPFSCKTLSENSRESSHNHFFLDVPVVNADITTLNGEALLRTSSLHRGEIDIIVGGPPCQSFSVFGKRGGVSDPRGMLGWEYLRLINELRPRAFVFENVPGLLTIENGDILTRLIKDCQEIGYTVSTLILEAAAFGVPQFRKRVFLVGSSDGKTVPPIQPTHFEPQSMTLPFSEYTYRTVRDAFRNLPPIGTLPNHQGRKHSNAIVSRYDNLSPGERDHKTRINRLNLDRPSFTIIVGSDKGGGKGHVHPTEPREVTPRESARIQTFPDWWIFSGTSRHPIRQIGNAVPPLLAAVLANHLRSHLFNCEKLPFEYLVDTLGQSHLYQDQTSCSSLANGTPAGRKLMPPSLENQPTAIF